MAAAAVVVQHKNVHRHERETKRRDRKRLKRPLKWGLPDASGYMQQGYTNTVTPLLKKGLPVDALSSNQSTYSREIDQHKCQI
jgi:hypothetical protein